MKTDNFAFCIFQLYADRCPLAAIFCLLIAVCCKLSAVRNLLHAAHYYSSITPASAKPGKSPKCGLNPFMPNEPNFQKSEMTVTLAMLRAYNDNQPEKRRKKRTQNEPKTNQNEPNSTRFALLFEFLYGFYRTFCNKFTLQHV